MPAKADIKVDTTGADRKTRTGKRLPEAAQYQLTKFGGLAVKKLKQATIGGNPLNTRSGHLRRNVNMKLGTKGPVTYLQLGTRKVKYANILDEGGKIVPKKKKYLTIPMPGIKGRARNYKNTFVFMSKNDNLFIAQRKRGKMRLLFLLKKKVIIPRLGWFTDTMAGLKPTLRAAMKKRALLAVAKRMA